MKLTKILLSVLLILSISVQAEDEQVNVNFRNLTVKYLFTPMFLSPGMLVHKRPKRFALRESQIRHDNGPDIGIYTFQNADITARD